MVRDGLISRQEFLTFYGKVLQNSDDDAFEKGIERFYSSSKIVTNEKIDNLKNDKLDAGLTQFKMFFKRMQNSTFVNHLRVWRTRSTHFAAGTNSSARWVLPRVPCCCCVCVYAPLCIHTSTYKSRKDVPPLPPPLRKANPCRSFH